MKPLKIALVIFALLISGCQHEQIAIEDIEDETKITDSTEGENNQNYKEDKSYNLELSKYLPNNAVMTDENNLPAHYLINNLIPHQNGFLPN